MTPPVPVPVPVPILKLKTVSPASPSSRLPEYRKLLVAAIGAILAFVATFAPQSHWTIAATTIATAAGVWRIPNAAQSAQSAQSAQISDRQF